MPTLSRIQAEALLRTARAGRPLYDDLRPAYTRLDPLVALLRRRGFTGRMSAAGRPGEGVVWFDHGRLHSGWLLLPEARDVVIQREDPLAALRALWGDAAAIVAGPPARRCGAGGRPLGPPPARSAGAGAPAPRQPAGTATGGGGERRAGAGRSGIRPGRPRPARPGQGGGGGGGRRGADAVRGRADVRAARSRASGLAPDGRGGAGLGCGAAHLRAAGVGRPGPPPPLIFPPAPRGWP